MAVRVVRQSKFRHVFGKAERKDGCIDNVRVTKTNWEGSSYCSVNSKFVAVIIDIAGGGAFVVQPLTKSGRVERDVPVVGGHKGEVLDIKWCPHDDHIIASGSDDCTVKVWQIPEGGLTASLNDPVADLVHHQRRVGVIEWHPVARNILLSAGADNLVCLWNIGTGAVLSQVELPNLVYGASFSYNGSKVVTVCKDRFVRVHNARTLDVVKEGIAHEGAKPSQAVFLKDDRIFTTGFSRMSERQYALWAADGENSLGGSEPLTQEDIDASNGVMFIFYDPDTNLVYLTGKGDSAIRYFEIADERPYVFYLTMYQSNQPQRGIGFMSKRGVNVNINEIARFYKLHAASGQSGGLCEPISMTVPRKSELFQDDLYPDTASGEAPLTAEEWFEGRDATPIMQSMRDLFQDTNKKTTQVKASVLGGTKPAAAKKPDVLEGGSGGGAAPKHSPAAGGAAKSTAATPSHEPAHESAHGHGGAGDPNAKSNLSKTAQVVAQPHAEPKSTAHSHELADELRALRQLVDQQAQKIEALEARLQKLEAGKVEEEEAADSNPESPPEDSAE